MTTHAPATIDADEKREKQYRKRVLVCPFCGQPPQILGSGEEWRGLMIHCVTDNCANPSVSYYSHAMALRVWNCRQGTLNGEAIQGRDK